MCQIEFKINTSSNVKEVKGRYKKVANSTWNNFTINKNDPKTPDIKVVGEYDLQVQIIDSNDIPSDWKPYKFKIAEDCAGGTGGVNVGPTAFAGPNSSTTGGSVLLDGSKSTDPDGTIKSYAWTQVSGPKAIISNKTLARATASLLTNAVYVFKLTVTDNDGATSSDTVQVTKTASGPGPVDSRCDCNPRTDCCVPCKTGGPGFQLSIRGEECL